MEMQLSVEAWSFKGKALIRKDRVADFALNRGGGPCLYECRRGSAKVTYRARVSTQELVRLEVTDLRIATILALLRRTHSHLLTANLTTALQGQTSEVAWLNERLRE